MKRLSLVIITLFVITIFSHTHAAEKSASWAVRMVESEIARNPEAWQLDFQPKLKWDYCHGLELRAMLYVADKYQREDIREYALSYADTMVNEDGSIKKYKITDYSLDRINSGKYLFDVYDLTGEERYKKALDLLRSQFDRQPRNADGGFWHKKIYPHQVWLDGVYMGSPFLAEYALRYESGEQQAADYADVILQMVMASYHTYDYESRLYRHACDVSRQMFWCDHISGQSKHCWGRALGWYAMAIVDNLELLPANCPDRQKAVNIMLHIAAQLERYADPATGLWYQVMDRSGDEGNYLESSASCMFAYALYKGVRIGILPSHYLTVADKAWQGILDRFIKEDEQALISITEVCAVAGLGGKNNRPGDYDYYINEMKRDNDAKAVGPFILAALEVERLQQK
ncbi:MAG: glycoside hydrolase family 88 protein [Bacteroidaceae bacterium]|nr:glycoside hydrolase family 88 protein [Bacteroidaceae bacterium]